MKDEVGPWIECAAPANIRVRPDGTVKVLDFGLAKSIERSGRGPDVSQSPTITTPAMTEAGIVLGTAAYMSPEQARGKPLDRRTDIWSFGCVLYEMLTGRRPFGGDDVSDVLASVLAREPDFSAVPPSVPPRFWLSAVAALVLALAAMAALALRPPPAPPEMRVDIAPPPSQMPASVAISPDGRTLAFVATSEGESRLWLRSIESGASRALAGTEGAEAPCTCGRFRALVRSGSSRSTVVHRHAGGATVANCSMSPEPTTSWRCQSG